MINGLLASVAVVLFMVLILIGIALYNSRPSVTEAEIAPEAVNEGGNVASAQLPTVAEESAADLLYRNQDRSPVAQVVAGPGQAKIIVDSGVAPRPTWTPTPRATLTPTPVPTLVPTVLSQSWQKPNGRPAGVGIDERWVDVDLSEQTLYVYEGNALIFQTLISSGLPEHPTVTGQFRIWLEYEKQTMDGRLLGYDYYLEDVPYVMYFFEDYALHGTYWHNNFGTPMSHGCVNMTTEDAGWVYNWATIGTVVNVHD